MHFTINKIKNNVILDRTELRSIKEYTLKDKIEAGIPLLPIIVEDKTKTIKTEKVESIVKPLKLVSLTFDDEPTEYTSELMEVLNENKSRGTFFMLGSSVSSKEEDIKLIASYGNEIGIHGYSRVPFTKMSLDRVREDILYTYNILDELGVNPSKIVRPPFGKLNETIKDRLGMPVVLSNINALGNTKDVISKQIIDNIKSGSIIKLHINKETIEALKELLPILRKQDYKFVTVSEMKHEYAESLEPGKVYAYMINKKAA